ncbi:MAG: HD domain-containing protein [Patescibacteria group bacterium]
MIYEDRIYGKAKIEHPLVLQLINHPLMTRLKGVNQAGYYKPFFGKDLYDRFEHSVGVYLLLRKFGAPFEEQIAGLIHDISHPVFSHCIDYALENGSGEKQSHQDSIFANYIRKSDLPDLLSEYGININYLLNEENFPLKEKDLPDLCADRLDYSLRNAISLGVNSINQVNQFISSLQTKDVKWVFSSFSVAKKYARTFRYMNKKYYCGWKSALMFASVGELVNYCLRKGYLTQKDLFTTDHEILEKVKTHLDDKKLLTLWERMNNKVEVQKDPERYQKKVACKSRIVDPYFKNGKKILRLSKAYSDWNKTVEKEMKPKRYFIRYFE